MMWRGESEIYELFERDETDERKVIHLFTLSIKHLARSVAKGIKMSWDTEACPFLN